jgi:hypothetical protein
MALALSLFATGCDDFGDTNVSPNASTTPLTSALLTNSLTQIGTSVTTGASLSSGFYAQYFTQTQYTETSLYAEQDVNWSGDIAGPIADLHKIIQINTDPQTAALAALQGSNNNQLAVARILKAYRFSVLTDRYGDMPYFDALKVDNLQPVFDTQQAIYKDIFKELDEAAAQFDKGLPVKGDILFSGDSLKWQKFANSLRLILALRIARADENFGKAQFNDALNANGTPDKSVISANADNVELTFPGGAFKNPFFAIAADQGIATTISDKLNNTNDRRRLAFGNATNGILVGFQYGLKREDALKYAAANASWSLILNNAFRAETSKLFVLTNADVLLARAEAAERGWTQEDPKTMYEAAIKASWQQWNVYLEKDDTKTAQVLESDAAARLGNFLTSPAIAYTKGAPDALEKIGTQRWITFYPNGPQGWSEWRRTKFPALVPTPNAVNTSKQIPVRFKYPSVEYGYNNAHITEAAARLKAGDNDNSPVWWNQ